jgi:hypothetical protein
MWPPDDVQAAKEQQMIEAHPDAAFRRCDGDPGGAAAIALSATAGRSTRSFHQRNVWISNTSSIGRSCVPPAAGIPSAMTSTSPRRDGRRSWSGVITTASGMLRSYGRSAPAPDDVEAGAVGPGPPARTVISVIISTRDGRVAASPFFLEPARGE